MSAPLAHLGEIRTRGWQILDELVNGKDTAQTIVAEGDWWPDLVTAVKPFSEWWAIKLGTTLSPIEEDEDNFAQDHLNKAMATDKRHCDAIRCHAVRLLRLDKLFDEIKDGTAGTPARVVVAATKKPGRAPGHGAYDDSAAVAEIERLVATDIAPWAASKKAEPLAARGISTEQNARRIYKKYKKLHP